MAIYTTVIENGTRCPRRPARLCLRPWGWPQQHTPAVTHVLRWRWIRKIRWLYTRTAQTARAAAYLPAPVVAPHTQSCFGRQPTTPSATRVEVLPCVTHGEAWELAMSSRRLPRIFTTGDLVDTASSQVSPCVTQGRPSKLRTRRQCQLPGFEPCITQGTSSKLRTRRHCQLPGFTMRHARAGPQTWW